LSSAAKSLSREPSQCENMHHVRPAEGRLHAMTCPLVTHSTTRCPSWDNGPGGDPLPQQLYRYRWRAPLRGCLPSLPLHKRHNRIFFELRCLGTFPSHHTQGRDDEFSLVGQSITLLTYLMCPRVRLPCEIRTLQGPETALTNLARRPHCLGGHATVPIQRP
jgi:hypothetical protein